MSWSLFSDGPCRMRVALQNEVTPVIDEMVADGFSLTFDHESQFSDGPQTHSYTFEIRTSVAFLTCNDGIPGGGFTWSMEFLPAGTINSVKYKSWSAYQSSSSQLLLDGNAGAAIYSGADFVPAPQTSFGGKVNYFSGQPVQPGASFSIEPYTDISYPVVAPDESLTTPQGEPVSASPDIRVNTVSVSVDSLAIISAPSHGTASASAGTLTYTPAPDYTGTDSYTYQADVWGGLLSNIATVGVTVVGTNVVQLPCTELGRITRCYVSGYTRNRVHDSRLVRGELRCLVANFNGAVDKSRTIVSVTWRMNPSLCVAMSNARIEANAREVAVDIRAIWTGEAAIKCEATMDNGEIYTQLFRIDVSDSPWFDGEYPTASGPTVLTATTI